jgi:hypothetical protein
MIAMTFFSIRGHARAHVLRCYLYTIGCIHDLELFRTPVARA